MNRVEVFVDVELVSDERLLKTDSPCHISLPCWLARWSPAESNATHVSNLINTLLLINTNVILDSKTN